MILNDFILPYTEIYGIILSGLIIFGLVVFSCKYRPPDALIGLDNTNFLKGLFILAVVFHHMLQRINIEATIIDSVVFKIGDNLGYTSVGVFFFLSGYGLSASKKTITFYKFLKLKLLRIYVPCLIVNLGIAVYLQRDLLAIFSPLTFDGTQWFIIAILYFYIFDFLSSKMNHNLWPIYISVILWVISCYFLELGGWWYVSTLCFPLGYIWQRYNTSISNILSDNWYKIFIILVVALSATYIVKMILPSTVEPMRMLIAVEFSLIILMLVSIYRPTNKVIELVGQSSLEIYILHMKVAWVMIYLLGIYEITSSFSILLYFSVLVVIGIVFFKFNNYMLKLVKNS